MKMVILAWEGSSKTSCVRTCFLTTKSTKGHEKNSWEGRRMLAVKAASMNFFRVLLCFSWLKKV